MKSWQEDLLSTVGGALAEQEIFDKIAAAARDLGFEYCSYGIRLPLPLSNPKVLTLFRYPAAWSDRYQAAGYVHCDPTVLHCRRTQVPVIWSDALFASTKELWDEARSADIRVGWAQSSLDANGIGGMLTLARSNEPFSAAELEIKELRMRWLVNMAHLTLTRALSPQLRQVDEGHLTDREVEVLKWSADGKTSADIGRILGISVDTVNFHIRNAIVKMGTPNKTAAVVRAVMLGLLNH